MTTISTDTVIQRLLALSAVRGALADRKFAHLATHHRSALALLIPVAIAYVNTLLGENGEVYCTDQGEIRHEGNPAITADTLTLLAVWGTAAMLTADTNPAFAANCREMLAALTTAPVSAPASRPCCWT